VVEQRVDLLASLAPVTKALRRIEDTAAGHFGLTMWQYAVLSVIVATPGLHQRAVAERLDYSANRIVADLDHLERKGLLVRRSGADRRSNALHATTAGAQVMRKIRTEIHRQEDELLSRLPARQRDALTSAVPLLAQALRERSTLERTGPGDMA
jgi:DNA-binding MarR family transcriptional regulator